MHPTPAKTSQHMFEFPHVNLLYRCTTTNKTQRAQKVSKLSEIQQDPGNIKQTGKLNIL